MNTVQELKLQWQALRYAVDMIDFAWSVPGPERPDEFDYNKDEMKAHREVLVKMQDQVLSAIYAAERENSEREARI